MRLIKAAELAAEWDLTEAELKRHVRRYGWPVVRMSRTDWRFTDQQIEQIVAMQSRASKPAAAKSAEKKTAGTGQSKRSKGRAA